MDSPARFWPSPMRQSAVLTKAIDRALVAGGDDRDVFAIFGEGNAAAQCRSMCRRRSTSTRSRGRGGSDGHRAGRRFNAGARQQPAGDQRLRQRHRHAHSGRRRREWRSRRRGWRRRRPCASGTQASVRPASDKRATALPSSPSSRARLIVCGSARSANMRAAVSATILSLSVTIAAPAFYAMAGTRRGHRAVRGAPLASGRLARKWRVPAKFCRLIGTTIPGSVIGNYKQKMGCRPAWLASAAHPRGGSNGNKYVALATAIAR